MSDALTHEEFQARLFARGEQYTAAMDRLSIPVTSGLNSLWAVRFKYADPITLTWKELVELTFAAGLQFAGVAVEAAVRVVYDLPLPEAEAEGSGQGKW